MGDHQRIMRLLGHVVIGIAVKKHLAVPTVVQIGKAGIDTLGPVNRPVNGPEAVARHRYPIQEMARAMGFDHKITEPRCHVARQIDIVSDGQRAKRKADIEIRRRIPFIRPLDETIVDVIARHHAGGKILHQHKACCAEPVRHSIALEKVVAGHQMVLTSHHGEVAEHRGPAIAQLHIVGIDVKGNAHTLIHIGGFFRRQKLATVDQKALTSTPDGGQTPVFRTAHKTVLQLKSGARGGQHDATGIAITLELDVRHDEFRQLVEAAEIHQILEAAERILLRALRIKQRRVQFQFLRTHILAAHINLAAHAIAFDQRPDLDIGDIDHIGQLARIRRAIGGLTGSKLGLPIVAERLKLTVADHPTRGKGRTIGDGGLHVDGARHCHPAATHIQPLMIRTVQQRLKRLLEGQLFIAKGLDIRGQVIALAQQQHLVRGHGQSALELHQFLDGHVLFQPECTLWHQNSPAIGGGTGRVKGIAVIRDPIANGTIIPHIHIGHQITQKDGSDVLDNDVIDADDTAIRPGQINAKMAINRRRTPDQIYTAAVARTNDGRHFDNRPVSGQGNGTGRRRHTRHRLAVAPRSIARHAHVRQAPAQCFDTGRHTQITAGQNRRLTHVAHARGV
mmetsp:Transcript_29466/g.57711  ORF Transcript_29466/g.57711 Transcript_29466/m.57711 type:complete len:621 (+) Transcript_29466:963-2825(+)